MGSVIRFPKRHARASIGSWAAKAVRSSAVTPFLTAISVAKIADHHSAGSLLRCHHFETTVAGAPVSEAIASLVGHSSTIARNVVSSGMEERIGQPVLKSKAIVSRDCGKRVGQTGLMADESEKLAESVWREGFRLRLIAARGNRSQAVMAELLDLKPNTYSKYEAPSRGSMMPVRKLPLFAKICGVDLVELIEGPKVEMAASLKKPVAKHRKSA
jgi:hypothetical protein